MRLIIIAQNCDKWKTWDAKIKELQEWMGVKEKLHVDLKHISLAQLEWSKYTSNDPAQQGEDWLGIEPVFYDKYISPYGIGYDAILFVIPRKEWKEPNKARGWRSDNDQGAVQLQIGCDENEKLVWTGYPKMSSFFQLARHELMHACYMITGQYDMTHYYWNLGQIEKARDNLVFPKNYQLPAIEKALNYLREIVNKFIAEQSKTPPVEESDAKTEKETSDLITPFCEAIKVHEGWFAPSPNRPTASRSYRNKNPGNFRCNAVMNRLATGKDADGFCIFPSEEVGMEALKIMVRNACIGSSKVYSPTMTIYEFFAKYAPSSDNNNPKRYAEFVANRVGLPPTTRISNLV